MLRLSSYSCNEESEGGMIGSMQAVNNGHSVAERILEDRDCMSENLRNVKHHVRLD
jgi:hypothetical protein